MVVIIGLGNPGKKYESTRHNMGFTVVDTLAGEKQWEFKRKFNAEICRLDSDVLLVKPQTFMNQSGRTLQLLTTYYKLLAANIWIIHDDVDLPLGAIRIKKSGGSAGHKGIKSIINHLKTENFVRFRMGINNEKSGEGNNIDRMGYKQNTEDFVLAKFAKSEKPIVKKLIIEAKDAVCFALENDIEKAMNKYN